MKKVLFFFFLLLTIASQATVRGQSNQTDARLFQNFFLDGSQVGRIYGEAGITFNDFNAFDLIEVGGRVGFPLGNTVELGAEWHFLNKDYNVGNSASGISDIGVIGRFLVSDGPTDISVGGFLTLPVGDADVDQGNVDLGFFGALRHPASSRLSVTGALGIEFIDRGRDYNASLRLGGGVIYQTNQNWHLIGELNFLTERDYALLTAGLDYPIGSSAKIRPALGLGLDNGAPDIVLILGVLFL